MPGISLSLLILCPPLASLSLSLVIFPLSIVVLFLWFCVSLSLSPLCLSVSFLSLLSLSVLSLLSLTVLSACLCPLMSLAAWSLNDILNLRLWSGMVSDVRLTHSKCSLN